MLGQERGSDARVMAAYEVLGLAPNAEHGSVHRAFRRVAKRVHPDVDRSPGATERFAAVVQAYQVLAARSPELPTLPMPGPDPRAALVARRRRVLDALALVALAAIAVLGAVQLLLLLS